MLGRTPPLHLNYGNRKITIFILFHTIIKDHHLYRHILCIRRNIEPLASNTEMNVIFCGVFFDFDSHLDVAVSFPLYHKRQTDKTITLIVIYFIAIKSYCDGLGIEVII